MQQTSNEHILQSLNEFINKLTAENTDESKALYSALAQSGVVIGFLVQTLANSIFHVLNDAIKDETTTRAIEAAILNYWIDCIHAQLEVSVEQCH